MKISAVSFPNILAVLFAGVVSCAQPAPEEKPQAPSENVAAPSIEFATTVYHFGRQPAGTDVTHEFVFTNKGNQPLEIESVRPTCGCTTSGKWDKLVQPGKKGKIPLKLKTAGYKGKMHKMITVQTNDPEHPTVRIAFKGEVWEPFELTPRSAAFGRVSDAATSATRIIEIVSNLDQPVKMEQLLSNNPLFDAYLQPIVPGKKWQLRVSLRPPLKEGAQHGILVLKTDFDEMPELKVNSTYYLPPPVQVSPARIVLPGGPLKGDMKKYVIVINHREEDLTLSDVEVTGATAEVNVTRLLPGKRFRFEIVFPKGSQIASDKDSALTFKTSADVAPEFSIPIVQHVLRPRVRPVTSLPDGKQAADKSKSN